MSTSLPPSLLFMSKDSENAQDHQPDEHTNETDTRTVNRVKSFYSSNSEQNIHQIQIGVSTRHSYHNLSNKKILNNRTIFLQPSPAVLNARRKVIHMLILVVVFFASCSLPFHVRKILLYYWPNYNYTSTTSYLITPITYILMYAHSAVNPVLYICMSRQFRQSSKDFIKCNLQSISKKARPVFFIPAHKTRHANS